jgi:transposase
VHIFNFLYGDAFMQIELLRPNDKPYLRLSYSKRMKGKSGKSSVHKCIVCQIGFLSEFDDGMPDYLQRLRQSFKEGTPLIPALQQYCINQELGTGYAHNFLPETLECQGNFKRASHILLERILEELGIPSVLAVCKHATKIEYDVYGFLKLVVFGRILDPASKFMTILQNNKYYEPIIDNHNPDNVYDTLTFIEKFKNQITRRMNSNLLKKAGRLTDVVYYDVTNFYFEIDEPDEDELDEYGNIITHGLRKMGICKEERKLPIVQMGLFMDQNGLPISVECFPGNTLDHLTLKYSLKNTIDGLDLSRFILIGDRGICVYSNLIHLLDLGNGYIVSKSLLKSTVDEREWAYSDKDYIHFSNTFKYKSRIVEKFVLDEKRKKRKITEKVLVYWSEDYAKKSEADSEAYFELLTKCTKSKKNFNISNTQYKTIKRFLSKDILNSNTGELLNSKNIKVLIDTKKVDEYKRNFGFYQIITSELDMDDLTIIERYRGLTEIENQFRIMKNTLETRPIFLRTEEHINAHMLTCMIALLIICIIQKKIVKSGIYVPPVNGKIPTPKKRDPYWTSGMSAERVQEALLAFQLEVLERQQFRFSNLREGDIKILLDAFKIDIPLKLFSKAEIMQLKSSINVF